jgi:hypothetical protein
MVRINFKRTKLVQWRKLFLSLLFGTTDTKIATVATYRLLYK